MLDFKLIDRRRLLRCIREQDLVVFGPVLDILLVASERLYRRGFLAVVVAEFPPLLAFISLRKLWQLLSMNADGDISEFG